jgi:ABC-2 type transport system ATP-binding protein
MYAIECQQLSKKYGRGRRAKWALEDLNLQIKPGQVYGFLGPNGAGKTTTIRLLLNLIRPSRGGVFLFGQPLSQDSLARVGAMVEGASFYPYLSAWDNLRVLGWTSGQFDPARAQNLLAEVGLAERAGDKAGAYSTGMKQRLGIAGALLNNPDLVILDEPTNGLDPAAIVEMRHFIRRLAHEEGKTVFISSHLLNEIQQTADRVAIIQAGRMLAEGRIEDLLAGSADELLIEAEPLEGALALLKSQGEARLSPSLEGVISLRVGGRAEVPKIVAQLVLNGVKIYNLRHKQQSLEDFFLQITARGEEDK